MSKTKILYHAGCMDGNGAKYAAWKKFGDHADYLPAQYGQPLPDLGGHPGSEIYMLDFSVPRNDLEALRRLYKRVVVVDHHVTAREALEGCNDVVFDMTKSGAVLAWEYFHPNDPVPMLLQYVQDRDLWEFKFPETKAVHSGLGLLRGNLKAWSNYAENSNELPKLVDSGKIILEREKMDVQNAVPKNVKVIDFQGFKAGIINTGELISEKGSAIISDTTLNVDLAVMWFVDKTNQVFLSMRSDKNGETNVAEICKKYGGGGHASAAGCRVDFPTLLTILEGKG